MRFHSGSTYGYEGVEPELWEAFLAADSKGKFFDAHIKKATHPDGSLKYPATKW